MIKLPFWMSREDFESLAAASKIWFEKLQTWAMWPAMQQDPDTCEESLLDEIAYKRDITRFKGEPLSLYRKRVKYAYINAKDAGSVAGFKRIFMRLGIGYVEVRERIPGIDWDIIDIELSDSQLAKNQRLLEELIQHYGRTCRRYRYSIITPVPMQIAVTEFNNDYQTISAKL